jgi:hypothetical protein
MSLKGTSSNPMLIPSRLRSRTWSSALGSRRRTNRDRGRGSFGPCSLLPLRRSGPCSTTRTQRGAAVPGRACTVRCPPGTAACYTVTDDPDAVFERVRGVDAEIVEAPHETAFGSGVPTRAFTARDPEGNPVDLRRLPRRSLSHRIPQLNPGRAAGRALASLAWAPAGPAGASGEECARAVRAREWP